MNTTSVSVNDGFDRFQRLLLAMHVGDELRPDEAADQTGLSADVCREVLLGLERAGLMTRGATGQNDLFVRRRLDLGS
jgi:DNA-binding GntR family transcriptional regulator